MKQYRKRADVRYTAIQLAEDRSNENEVISWLYQFTEEPHVVVVSVRPGDWAYAVLSSQDDGSASFRGFMSNATFHATFEEAQ